MALRRKELPMTNKEVTARLNGLIETCKDGEYGFRACAEHVRSLELKTLFTLRADDCKQAASDLQAHVVLLGGEPDRGGTTGGALHRGWVAVRGTLAGYSDVAMLEECERGEDVALARYREVLENDLPIGAKAVVERQYRGVKRNHAQVRELRDRMKAAA
jgi:uncharacterized protein (TIGR02284 family)